MTAERLRDPDDARDWCDHVARNRHIGDFTCRVAFALTEHFGAEINTAVDRIAETTRAKRPDVELAIASLQYSGYVRIIPDRYGRPVYAIAHGCP